jgi:hypothetical protein
MRARAIAVAVLASLAIGESALAAPLFVDATAALGAPQPCGGSGCYSSYVALADLDGDGDLDAVFANGGGYYEPASAEPMTVYFNDGTGHFDEVNASVFGGFTGRLRQIAVADVDGDGDLDLYAPDSWAMQPDALFVNDGAIPPTFVDEGPARLPVSSRAGAARFGDLDADGDMDLVLTDWGPAPPTSPGTAHVYVNDGTGHFAEKPDAVPMDTSAIGTGPIDVDLLDSDGDFDLDMLLASRDGDSLLFVNDGTGAFAFHDADLPPQPGPYVYGPDACDVDGDGDLDLWLDNGASGLLEQLLVDDGKGVFTDETAGRVTGNPSADDNEVQCVDIDDDGDFDALIASLSDEERVLVNDGTGHFALDPGAFPAASDSTLGLDLGDVDGDGRLDAITAQGESGSLQNRLYLGVAPQPVDTRPPIFRAVEQLPDAAAAGTFAVRFAVVDRATSDSGPRLREAHLDVSGAAFPATFMGGDLFRAPFPAALGDSVTYRACATDAAGNAACSEPRSFRVGAGGAGASTGQGGDGAPPDASDEGCGCRVNGAPMRDRGPTGLFAIALVGLALRRRG